MRLHSNATKQQQQCMPVPPRSRSSNLQNLRQRVANCGHFSAAAGCTSIASQLNQRRARCVVNVSVTAVHQGTAHTATEAEPAHGGLSTLSGPATEATAGAAAATAAATSSGCWRLLSRSSLAGGTLDVVAWDGARCLRVWLPPGYSLMDAQADPYPALYLNDGQNLFGDCTTLSGQSWGAAHTATQLITSGKLPPFIIVGIDHAGVLRSLEYTPCKPGSGPGGFRSDAASWPGGGATAYLERVRQEVVPWVSHTYAASADPQDLAFGGSSFGGIAALVEGMRGASGCAFGALLVESPSLWIGEPQPESFLQALLAYRGTWPERIYLGMGGREFSGTRGGAGQEHDQHFASYLSQLYAKLTASGLGPSRLAWTLEPEHGHTESAWAARLPAALQFVAGGWWQRWQQRYNKHLFFTVPRRLKPELPGQVMFVNKQRSHPLAGVAGGIKLIIGRDGWQDTQQLLMTTVSHVQHAQVQPPKDLQEQVLQQWQQEYREQLRLQEEQRQRLLEAERAEARRRQLEAASSSGDGGDRDAAPAATASQGNEGAVTLQLNSQQLQQQQQQHPQIEPTLQRILDQPVASCCLSVGDWFMVQLPPLPADCYEVNFVFSDEGGNVYDNNARNDFYLPVRQPELLQEVPASSNGSSSSSSNSSPTTTAGRSAPSSSMPECSTGIVAAAAAFAGDACGFLEQDVSALAAAACSASIPADKAAAAAAANYQLFFSVPPVPVADAVSVLYVNRSRLGFGVAHATKLKAHIGYNSWQMGRKEVELQPAALPAADGVDWWCVDLVMPGEAVLASFAFSAEVDGVERWDNNHGHNYHLPVRSVTAAVVAAAAEATMLAAGGFAKLAAASSNIISEFHNRETAAHLFSGSRPNSSTLYHSNSSSSWWRQSMPSIPPGLTVREVESCEAVPHADGTLEILQLKKRARAAAGTNGSSKEHDGKLKRHWWDEKRVRVWLPAGFSAQDAPPGGWPALIMCDGQNMFEDWLAHQGVSWNVGHCASSLIAAGSIPPCICIAIDSAGPYRSYNYLPFKPGTGKGGFRQDCAKWPGGGARDFLDRVAYEILPMLQERYNIAQCSSRLAFGGGSFAGVTALMAAISMPHVFGGVLVESPSLWAGEGGFLQDLAQHSGRLPERLSLGCGTREYSATRDHERHDLDQMLLQQYHEAARLLQQHGMRGSSRFMFVVDQGAGHHEGAWRWRLNEALPFLAQGWWGS